MVLPRPSARGARGSCRACRPAGHPKCRDRAFHNARAASPACNPGGRKLRPARLGSLRLIRQGLPPSVPQRQNLHFRHHRPHLLHYVHHQTLGIILATEYFIATLGTVTTLTWIGFGLVTQRFYLRHFRIINILMALTLLECVWSMLTS